MNASDPTTSAAPTPAPPPAIAAFLRGVGRRAIVFAQLQCGDPDRAAAALTAVLPRFTAQAGTRPMAQWPALFWGLLLASPELRPTTSVEPQWPPAVVVLGRLGAGPRSAVLLWLVAGLDEDAAAAALGVDAPTWRLALQRAALRDAHGELDVDAWHRLAAAGREAQQAVPATRLALWERDCRAALAHSNRAPMDARRAWPRWLLPMLWTGFAACVVALLATFVWPVARPGAGAAASDDGRVVVRRAPLPAPAAPLATFDAAFALRHHPDLAQLATGDEALLRDLDFHAWHAAQIAMPPFPVDPAPAAEPDPDAMAPAQREALRLRLAEWDALAPAARRVRRERWQAWQQLPAQQRAAVLDAATTFAALPPERQQALRSQFDQLSPDARRGWWLGPGLGMAWPRLQPLLMQVPAAQRGPLLATLHELSPLQLDDLATLAQRTPPQERDALRRELLSTSEANRAAWLRERLHR